jgi:hypothetical protein
VQPILKHNGSGDGGAHRRDGSEGGSGGGSSIRFSSAAPVVMVERRSSAVTFKATPLLTVPAIVEAVPDARFPVRSSGVGEASDCLSGAFHNHLTASLLALWESTPVSDMLRCV